MKNTIALRQGGWRGILLLLLLLAAVLSQVQANPTGAAITSASVTNGPVRAAGMRNDSPGNITTLLLYSLQQDQHWKGYVGNISGALTLDDLLNMTLYSWDVTSITGQVYASRYNNVSWTSITCATQNMVQNESAFNNMTSSQPDRLNATFNWSIHKAFTVGSTTLAQNTCNSTITYANDTRLAPTTASPFQEVLIMDSTNNYLVYMTGIDDNTQGFDNTTYDFQMIVGESDIKASNTAYYFYVELR